MITTFFNVLLVLCLQWIETEYWQLGAPQLVSWENSRASGGNLAAAFLTRMCSSPALGSLETSTFCGFSHEVHGKNQSRKEGLSLCIFGYFWWFLGRRKIRSQSVNLNLCLLNFTKRLTGVTWRRFRAKSRWVEPFVCALNKYSSIHSARSECSRADKRLRKTYNIL